MFIKLLFLFAKINLYESNALYTIIIISFCKGYEKKSNFLSTFIYSHISEKSEFSSFFVFYKRRNVFYKTRNSV